MKYTVIKTSEQYNLYCDLLEEMADDDMFETDEFELLELLIEVYDSKNCDEMGLNKKVNPIDLILSIMEDHKMNTRGLADKLKKSEGYVSNILNKKKPISKNVAIQLSKLFALQLDALLRPYDLESKKILHVERITAKEKIYRDKLLAEKDKQIELKKHEVF